MKIRDVKTRLFGKIVEIEVMEFDETDRIKWHVLFEKWATLNRELKEYGARGLPFPEGLSEVAFCLLTKSVAVFFLKQTCYFGLILCGQLWLIYRWMHNMVMKLVILIYLKY